MTPKIIFKYSSIYDEEWKEVWNLKHPKWEYPSPKEIKDYIKGIKPLWQKREKKVLSELSKITTLKWSSKLITCYVVGRTRPFSDPLTIPVYDKDPESFIDILTHELIHQLFIQEGSRERTKKSWEHIFEKYRSLPYNTKIHIPLHAIHAHIYEKLFTKERMDKDIEEISFLEDYRKSWEVVQKESYQNIISEFVKRIEKKPIFIE